MENADLKMRDQTACVENVRLENAEPEKKKGNCTKTVCDSKSCAK